MTDESDPFQLQRFVDAQEGTIDRALAELWAGEKRTNWIWYVFPQLAELGRSPTAKFYGLRSLTEARAYLAHPLLGERYREAVQALLQWVDEKSAVAILGDVDALKLRSSLSLFEAASGDPRFARALGAFFDGPDPETLRLIGQS